MHPFLARDHLARLDRRVQHRVPARSVAVLAAVTLCLGVGAATRPAADPRLTVTPAAQVVAVPEPTAPAAARPQAGPLRTPPTSAPAPRPAPPQPTKKVSRWLPSGTGMWLHEWRKSEQGHAPVVVQRAEAAGLTHLYVQTGSTRKGWIGDEVLGQLLPATAGTDLRVIAWDFPKLHDPVADARRMARAASFRKAGAPRVAAVAPDVETAAEGTRVTAQGIETYYSTLRRLLPPHIAILATIPWPSEKRTGSYPYARTARHSDALVPMAYWYNRSPATVTATSMTWLKRFGKPVMPVGQGYDGRLDAPYLAEDPAPDRSVRQFLDTAKAHGARSVSLWSWQTTGPLQWRELSRSGTGKQFVPAGKAPGPAPTVAWTTRGRAKP